MWGYVSERSPIYVAKSEWKSLSYPPLKQSLDIVNLLLLVSECQPVRCRMYCQFGWQKGEDGCDMCQCAPHPCEVMMTAKKYRWEICITSSFIHIIFSIYYIPIFSCPSLLLVSKCYYSFDSFFYLIHTNLSKPSLDGVSNTGQFWWWLVYSNSQSNVDMQNPNRPTIRLNNAGKNWYHYDKWVIQQQHSRHLYYIL